MNSVITTLQEPVNGKRYKLAFVISIDLDQTVHPQSEQDIHCSYITYISLLEADVQARLTYSIHKC